MCRERMCFCTKHTLNVFIFLEKICTTKHHWNACTVSDHLCGWNSSLRLLRKEGLRPPDLPPDWKLESGRTHLKELTAFILFKEDEAM